MRNLNNEPIFENKYYILKIRSINNLSYKIGKIEELLEELEKVMEQLAKFYIKENKNGKLIPLKQYVNDFEKKLIIHTLKLVKGNQKIASYFLGVRPTTFNEKIKRHKIKIIKVFHLENYLKAQ